MSFLRTISMYFNVIILRKNICMVKVITVKVIIHGSIILKMCFKLKFFQMFCTGIEQIAYNCLGFWLCFLTVVSINEDVETYCCRFC